ncbi:ROK family protein [Hippea jasoniae]|uniref:ROK family protein n=1 Tax=Hippea jasoniae TaxID=944479 RepID=UPI00068C82F2|nr:ROK family protein [Hippea jasoniae]
MTKAAVDIGATYTRYIIENTEEKTIKTKDIKIVNFLNNLIETYNINTIAISFAGYVYNTTIIDSPNINIKNINLKEAIGKKDTEIILENDLNCAALAESKYFNSKNIAAIYSGSGLGCGAVVNNHLLKGDKGISCELGHISFKKAPFVCGCGKNDCIELFASGSGLKKWIEYYHIHGFKLNEIEKEKPIIVENFIEALSFAISIVINMLNPQLVVLGGGIIQSNSFIVKRLKEKVKQLTIKPLSNTPIELSKLKNGSLEGARILAGMV